MPKIYIFLGKTLWKEGENLGRKDNFLTVQAVYAGCSNDVAIGYCGLSLVVCGYVLM